MKKLLNLISQLKPNSKSSALYAGLETVEQDTDGDTIYKLPSNKLEDSYAKCKKSVESAASCALQTYAPSSTMELTAR